MFAPPPQSTHKTPKQLVAEMSKHFQGRSVISLRLLAAAIIFSLAANCIALVSTKSKDAELREATSLRTQWEDTKGGDDVAEMAAIRSPLLHGQLQQQVNSTHSSNSSKNPSQPLAADSDQWEAAAQDNETTTYGPLLELNAIQAAERGYFRHSTSASVIVTIAYALVFIIGLIGNSFVVTIVCKSPRMRTVTNYFIANLALADILVLLFCLPATLVGNLFIPYVLGEWVCKTVSYLQGVAVSASINTMMTVTLDRFLAICFPMDWHMSRRTARRVIACIWLFSLTIALPWALFFRLVPYPHETNMLEICVEAWPTARWGKLYFVLANLVLLYLFPAVVITFCYLGIWYKIERRNIPGDQPKGLKIELIMQKSKLKVIKMMMLVVLIFLVSWFPTYVIFVRLKLFDSNSLSELEDWIIQNTMPFAQWLGASNSCINPILYTFFNRKYKRGLIDLLRCAFCCRAPTKMGATLSDQSQFGGEAGVSRPVKHTDGQGHGRRHHHHHQHSRGGGVQNGGLSMVSLNATPIRSSNGRPTCQSTTLSTDVHTSTTTNNGPPSSKHSDINCDRKSEASTGQPVRVGSPLHERSVNQTDTNASESFKQQQHHSKKVKNSRQVVEAAARRKHQCGCKSRRRTKSAGTRPLMVQEELQKAHRDALEVAAPVATTPLSSSTPILDSSGVGPTNNLLAPSAHEADGRRMRFIGSHRARPSGSCSVHHNHTQRRDPSTTGSEPMAKSDCCVDRRHWQQQTRLLDGVNEDDGDDESAKLGALSGEESTSNWNACKRSSSDDQPRRQSDNSNNSNAYGHQINQIELSTSKRAVSGEAMSTSVQGCQLCGSLDNQNSNLASGTRQRRLESEAHSRHGHRHAHGRQHRGHRHRRHTCSKWRDLNSRDGASRATKSQSNDCVNERSSETNHNYLRCIDGVSSTNVSGARSFEKEDPAARLNIQKLFNESNVTRSCDAMRANLHGGQSFKNNSNNKNTRDTSNTTTESTEVITLSPTNQTVSLICMESISLTMDNQQTTSPSKHINLVAPSEGASSPTSNAPRSLVNKMRNGALDKSLESSPEAHVLTIATDSDLDDNRHDEQCERRKGRYSDRERELNKSPCSADASVGAADEDGSTTRDYGADLEEEVEESEEEEEEGLLFGSEEDSPSRQTRIERLRYQQSELNEQLRKKHERTRERAPACQRLAKSPEGSAPVATNQRPGQPPTGRLIAADEISGYQVAIMSLAASSSNLANLAMQKLSSSCKFARRRTTSGCERTSAKRGSLSPSGHLNEQPLANSPGPHSLLSGQQNGHSLSSRFSWEIRAKCRSSSGANNHASGDVNMQNDMKLPAGATTNMTSSWIKGKREKQRTTSAGQIIKSNVMRTGNCNIAPELNHRGHEFGASSVRLGEQTSLLSSSSPVSATNLA